MTEPRQPLIEEMTRLRPTDDDDDDATRTATTSSWAHAVLDAGLLDLPLPGRGGTAERYAALTAVGSVDLDLARLVEAHTDAVAILADLGADRWLRRPRGGPGLRGQRWGSQPAGSTRLALTYTSKCRWQPVE